MIEWVEIRGYANSRNWSLLHEPSGLTVEYAITSGGLPPGGSGMQTNVSRKWWRVESGPWWGLETHSRGIQKKDLIGVLEILLEAGVLHAIPEGAR